jgi:hypothetical protein
MENFTSTGDAAAAFVEQFGKAGATIDLGPLIAFGNALTSPQLADALHTNNQGLGELVRNIAALGNRRNDPAAFTKAVESAGVSMDALGNSSADAQLNLEALTEQFQQGAKSAFDQEVADKKNVLVSDQVVAAIRAKAAATNDYVDAQDELTAAQQAAAQAAFALLSAQLNPDEAQKIIDDNTTYTVGINNTRIATVDWTKANLDAQQALAKVDNAFVDLGTRFPGFNQAFNALSQGIADGADSLVDFAVRSDKAKLSADDLNAVANKLGPALGQALSGDELSKVLVAAKARVDEFSTALAGLVPSITGLQVTADGFTLDHFLGQLELIAIARTSVIKNLNAIADQFGQLGADAIEALTKSGLQGDTFAIAVQQALAGGPKALQRVVDDFQAATGLALGQFGDTTVQDLQGLSQKLTAQGLTPETIDKILGTDAFKNAADDQKGALDKLNVDLFNFALQRNQIIAAAGQGPLTGAALAALQLTNAAIDQAQAAIGAGGQPNVVVPTVDTQKAQTDAAAAGHLAAQSFTQQMSTDIFGGFVDVDNQVYSGIDALGPAGSLHAQAAALQVASGLIFGTVAGLGPFADAVSTAVGTSTLKAVPVALAVGGAVAAAFGQGVVQIVADVAATGEAAELEIRKFDFVGTALMSIAAADFVHSFEGNFDELPVVVAVDLDLVLGAIGSAAPSFELAAAGLALLTASAFAGNLQLVGVVNSALNDALTAMTGFLPLFQGEGFQIGTALGQGVKDGLNSTVEQIAAAAADAVAKAEEAAKQQAGAHSPSRVFARLGMDLSRGLAQGIAQGAPQVEQAAAASVQAAQAGVVHNHQWNIDVPTDDPAMFARRAADRLERRLV